MIYSLIDWISNFEQDHLKNVHFQCQTNLINTQANQDSDILLNIHQDLQLKERKKILLNSMLFDIPDSGGHGVPVK